MLVDDSPDGVETLQLLLEGKVLSSLQRIVDKRR